MPFTILSINFIVFDEFFAICSPRICWDMFINNLLNYVHHEFLEICSHRICWDMFTNSLQHFLLRYVRHLTATLFVEICSPPHCDIFCWDMFTTSLQHFLLRYVHHLTAKFFVEISSPPHCNIFWEKVWVLLR